MAGKMYSGDLSDPKDPRLMKAYCEGRAASVAAAAIGTNPHPSGTPARQAWDNGHRLYASGGATTIQDCCSSPAKFTMPTITCVLVGADTTNMTYRATLSAAIPTMVLWGDGYDSFITTANGTADHQYKNNGVYKVTPVVMGKLGTPVEITVTYVAP